ncbi:MAG TPA: hypothetical protein VFF06_03195 [Polyangia bacterium]|nr:hypothetical protein [Polyangia bacterium]
MGDERSSNGAVQAHDGDAEATLDEIDAVILFPVLGAPCVVPQGDDTYLEVIIALEKDAHVSPGSFAHYLQFRPFQDPYPETDDEAEQGLDEARAAQVFVTQDAWSLSDFGSGVSAEKPAHIGTDGAQVTLDKPIFPVTTCRMHSIVVDKLKDDYPDVYRVLFKSSVFPVGQMMELHWLSRHHHDGFMDKVKDNARSFFTRGKALGDEAYAKIHMRHPFIVQPADHLPKKFAHLTDIHNSTAHNLLNLSNCSVLEGQSDRYSFPVGSRMNNYNRNFSHLAESADADAYVLTGDIVDYGRGLYYSSTSDDHKIQLSPPNVTPDALQDLLVQAGRSGDPQPLLQQARSLLAQKVIWEEMGGNDQCHYHYDANFWYFVLEKILPRYVGDKPRPVFTSLGNHDFHPNPFPPWPTSFGSEDEDSKNPFTPSDYNLTRYEALLAYGPKSYCPYGWSTVLSMMSPIDVGGSGLISKEACCMMYFFFVNPWLDYSVRFGDHSIMLVDFGRKEVRPQGVIGSLLPAIVGGALIAGGIAMLVAGAVTHSPALAIAGAVVAALGAVVLGSALAEGLGAGSFESLDDLPAAQEALSDDQAKLLDNWTSLDANGRAMFCHALVLGRAQKMISLQQLNTDGFGGNTFDKMTFGVLAKNRRKVFDAVQQQKITVTMSGHSHFSSVYMVPESGDAISAEWPGTTETPRDRLIVVTPASGPMAEMNRAQDDEADGTTGKSKAIDRQLRDAPGASVLEIADGKAIVHPLIAQLPQNKPRRAAYDSWKNRFDGMSNWIRTQPEGPSVEDENVRLQLGYVSDVQPSRTMQMQNAQVTQAQAEARWTKELAQVTFFPSSGGPVTLSLTLQSGTYEASLSPSTSQSGYTAHMYELVMSREQYQMLKTLAGTRQRIMFAVEYPESDQDPWIFELTVDQVTSIGRVAQHNMRRNEFPEFDKRVSDLHYDQPFGNSSTAAQTGQPSGQ